MDLSTQMATAVEGTRKGRVLVVEDDEDYALSVRRLLARLGYAQGDVEIVHDEATALRRLEDTCFDVVVSDLDLQPGNGIRVLQRVRDRWPEAQRILLTSSPEKARSQMTVGADLANGIWDKKWELGTIREHLKSLLKPMR